MNLDVAPFKARVIARSPPGYILVRFRAGLGGQEKPADRPGAIWTEDEFREAVLGIVASLGKDNDFPRRMGCTTSTTALKSCKKGHLLPGVVDSMRQRPPLHALTLPCVHALRWVATATLSLAVFGSGTVPSLAYELPEAICDQARAIFESTGQRWTYLEHYKNGPAVSLNGKIPAKYIEGNSTPARIIYLATGPRYYKSWFGVRIAYQGAEKNNIIWLKNSTHKSFKKSIEEYNSYHDGSLPGDAAGFEDYQFRFHMRNTRSASDAPESVRQEYYYEPWEQYADRRAYVIPMQELRAEGSCMHFFAVIPRSTNFIKIKIIDVEDDIPITEDYIIMIFP